MPFEDAIQSIADKIPDLQSRRGLQTEEATKQALILPFILALGYNVFNTAEVQPEATADFGTRQGGKVDYAILSEKTPIIIIECKQASSDLADERFLNQLLEYFSATAAKAGNAKGLIGILTNGILYKFFTDKPDNPNVMDKNPFWEVDLESLSNRDFEQLAKFAKGADLAKAVDAASELNNINSIKDRLASQLENPDDSFVELFGRELHSGGNFTPTVRERFRPLVRRAFQEFLGDKIRQGADRAAESITTQATLSPIEEAPPHILPGSPDTSPDADGPAESQPTAEELEGYEIVKAIVGDVVDASSVTIRDAQQYCAVLLDDNNRRPLCRLHFNTSQKYIGLFDGSRASSGAQIETRHSIESLQDIQNHADQLRETARRHLKS